LVIFTGDNGYFHADHGLADKWYPYEESIRVPLIVRDPRMAPEKRGATNDDFVLNVDVAPTILAATGVPAPLRMQGRDFSSLYFAAEKPAWREEFFYEHATIKNVDFIPSSEALVRKDIKYLWWPDSKYEELFDLRADRLEAHNLATDPAYKDTISGMRKRFEELKAQAK
jgi:arylsulfatase A-like enzyme